MRNCFLSLPQSLWIETGERVTLNMNVQDLKTENLVLI